MQHEARINAIIAETGMGESAAINRYLAERALADIRRRDPRAFQRATNWIK